MGTGSRGGWGGGRGDGGWGGVGEGAARGGERLRGAGGGADQTGLLSQSGTDLRLGVAPSAMAVLAGGV